ncbi:hypothetical protein B0J11DRAFT_341153 [Dendryphion nanum]|uniref:Uncharacterized protein n=1 Tax=Dendryphion nanum TaxID=256645 RepID=A0A9P9IKF7_9PLEO|nr:hypothetical protein B0J11DRAFT_341153 [Dendryphion nanum]
MTGATRCFALTIHESCPSNACVHAHRAVSGLSPVCVEPHTSFSTSRNASKIFDADQNRSQQKPSHPSETRPAVAQVQARVDLSTVLFVSTRACLATFAMARPPDHSLIASSFKANPYPLLSKTSANSLLRVFVSWHLLEHLPRLSRIYLRLKFKCQLKTLPNCLLHCNQCLLFGKQEIFQNLFVLLCTTYGHACQSLHIKKSSQFRDTASWQA